MRIWTAPYCTLGTTLWGRVEFATRLEISGEVHVIFPTFFSGRERQHSSTESTLSLFS